MRYSPTGIADSAIRNRKPVGTLYRDEGDDLQNQ